MICPSCQFIHFFPLGTPNRKGRYTASNSMLATPPRVALVGLGGYARQHLTLLDTLHHAGLCQLVAVADPFAARHPEVVAALGSQGTQLCDSLETVLEREDVEAVFLATPIPLHANQTVRALNAGKHVYLEKPPCATLGEWEAMNAAQTAAGRVCAVGFQMQSNAAVQFVKRRLVEGALGRLHHIWGATRWRRTDAYYARSPWAGCWRFEGQPVFDGPATNALAHMVQGSLFLAGETPREVASLRRVRGALWRARPIESYDCAWLEAETSTGVQLALAVSHATAFTDEVMLSCAGERGRADVCWNGTVQLHLDGQDPVSWHFLHDPALAATLDFLRAIARPDALPALDLQGTLPYLQMVNGALQSSRGARDFESARVSYLADASGDGFYQVAEADEQFAPFRRDFAQPPAALFRPDAPWIEPEQLGKDLVVD